MCLDNPADHKNKLVHLGAQDILMVVNITVERNIAFAKLMH